MMFINTVPGSVSITVIQPLPTSVIVLWQVWLVDNNVGIMLFAASFQPPPLIDGFPVLHYVVSYNTSDNSTVIQTQLGSCISSYTVSSEPGVTYYITVRAVNAVGPGPHSIATGKMNKVIVIVSLFCAI